MADTPPQPEPSATHPTTDTDRGLAVAVEYAMTLGIAGLLLVGITAGITDVVETQKQQVTDEQLQLVGERIAGDIETASRVVAQTDPTKQGAYETLQPYPDSIAGDPYTVTITKDYIRVSSADGSLMHQANHTAQLPVKGATVRGGELRIGWNGEALTVRPDTRSQIDSTFDSTFELTGVTAPSTAIQGTTVNVDVTVTNTGSTQNSQPITLAANGRIHEQQRITLDAGETKSIELSWLTGDNDVGDQTIVVTSEDEQVTNSISITGTEGNFQPEIVGTNTPSKEHTPLTVDVKVRNYGYQNGFPATGDTKRVTLSVDGDTVTHKQVSLPSGGPTRNTAATKTVQLEWTPSDGTVGSHTITAATEDGSDSTSISITDGPSAEYDVTIGSVNTPVEEGERVTLLATVENTGERAGDQDVTFNVNGQPSPLGISSVYLDPSEAQTVQFNWDTVTGDNGTHTATVASDDDTATDSITIGTPSKANFAVTLDYANGNAVDAGSTADITVTVENTGVERGSQPVVLYLDGSAVAGNSVALDSGDSTQFTLQWDAPNDRAGETLTGRVKTNDDQTVLFDLTVENG